MQSGVSEGVDYGLGCGVVYYFFRGRQDGKERKYGSYAEDFGE